MLSPYYRLLEIPVEVFDKEKLSTKKSQTIDVHKNYHWNGLVDVLNNEAHNFFSKFNYQVSNVELFYTPPGGILEWHIDMNPPEDFMKINFVWGSESHCMCWGELKNPSKHYETSITRVSSQYIKLTGLDVFLKKTLFINVPTLVNVGKPHKIYNYGENGRWCLSIILCHQGKRIMFADAVNKLSEYVVG